MAEFENENEGREKNYIKEYVDELESKQLTHQNYKKDLDKVLNYCESIELQIENHLNFYEKFKEKHEKYLADKRIANYIKEEKVIPQDVYDALLQELQYLEEVQIWKFLQYKLAYLSMTKLMEAISAVRAHDIEKEVLQNFREVSNDLIGMNKEFVNERMKILDEQFLRFRENMDLRFQNLQNNIQSVLVTQIKDIVSGVATPVSNIKIGLDNEVDNRPQLSMLKKPKNILKQQEVEEEIEEDETEIENLDDVEEEEKSFEQTIKKPQELNKAPSSTDCNVCGKKLENINALNAHKKFYHGGKN